MDLPGSLRIVHPGGSPGTGLRAHPVVDRPFLGRRAVQCESNRLRQEAWISGNPRPERSSRTRRTCIEEGSPRLPCPYGHRQAFCAIVGRPVENQIGLGRKHRYLGIRDSDGSPRLAACRTRGLETWDRAPRPSGRRSAFPRPPSRPVQNRIGSGRKPGYLGFHDPKGPPEPVARALKRARLDIRARPVIGRRFAR